MASDTLEPEDILDFYEDDEESSESESENGPDSSDSVEEASEPVTSEETTEPAADETEAPRLETLEGKTITLCGSGHSLNQFFSELDAGAPPGDEVWAVDNVGRFMHHDKVFYMEHPDVQKPGDWLKEEKSDVYVSELSDDVPKGILYPVEDVVQNLGIMYIDSSAAYALALAVYLRAAKVRLFGLDFDSDPVKRGCIEFIICKAIHTGVGIEIPSSSSLLGNNLTVGDRLYGFKHSKDPFVMVVVENGRRLVRFSKLPENAPKKA